MIPDLCMQYTEVFRTVRLEHGALVIFGVVVGLLAAWLGGRR